MAGARKIAGFGNLFLCSCGVREICMRSGDEDSARYHLQMSSSQLPLLPVPGLFALAPLYQDCASNGLHREDSPSSSYL